MRKSAQIQTWLMLISWMIIFLHGVIPHNHKHSHKEGCHNLVHSIEVSHSHHDDCDHNDAGSPLYNMIPAADSETVCHFDTRLFQNFQVDYFFIARSGLNSPHSMVPETPVVSVDSELKKPPAFRSCMLLRAPPNIA